MAFVSEAEQQKRKLKRLIDRTKENQTVLEHFQLFEMSLLGSENLTNLLENVIAEIYPSF